MKFSRPTWTLPQWLCLAGIIVVLVSSIWIGAELWLGRGDPFAALITAGCEMVAVGGFVAAWHASRNWAWWKQLLIRLLGVSIVLLAAGWVVFTTYEKLDEDAQKRARDSVTTSEVYQLARQDWLEARSATNMDDYRARNPRPTCICPSTVEAWDAGFQAEATRRERVVAQRQERMQGLIPEVTLDPVLVYRSVTVEAIKLFGFIAFGVGGALHSSREAQPTPNSQPRPQQPRPEPPVRAEREPREPRKRTPRAAKRVSGGGVDAEVWQMVDGDD